MKVEKKAVTNYTYSLYIVFVVNDKLTSNEVMVVYYSLCCREMHCVENVFTMLLRRRSIRRLSMPNCLHQEKQWLLGLLEEKVYFKNTALC